MIRKNSSMRNFQVRHASAGTADTAGATVLFPELNRNILKKIIPDSKTCRGTKNQSKKNNKDFGTAGHFCRSLYSFFLLEEAADDIHRIQQSRHRNSRLARKDEPHFSGEAHAFIESPAAGLQKTRNIAAGRV